MLRVEHYDQYKKMAEYFNPKDSMTNLYMMPEELHGHIERGNLYYDDPVNDDILLFYLENEFFYKLYMFTKKGEAPSIPFINKPIVADLVYTEKNGEGVMADLLRKTGFEHLALYRQNTIRHSEINFPENDLEGYRVDFATRDQVPAILSMLYDIFPPVSNELPDEALLAKLVEERAVLSFFSPSGNICGCSQWERMKETCLMKHLALIPEERGKGLSMKLYYEVLKKAQAKNYKNWVEINNTVKQKLDAALGYRFNGKYMLKLIFGDIKGKQ